MRYFFWALTTILLAGACASSDAPQTNPGDGCAINSDCSTPLVCAFRKCHMACLDTRDCPTNQRCMASDRPFHVCQLPTETKCGYNSDCPEGQICAVDGQCRDQCTSDRDCVSHQICTARSCAEVVELDGGALTPVAVPEESGAPSNGLALPVHLGLSDQPDLPFVWVVRTRMRDVPRLCGGLRLPGGRLQIRRRSHGCRRATGARRRRARTAASHRGPMLRSAERARTWSRTAPRPTWTAAAAACPPCATGGGCTGAKDCASGKCDALVCQMPTCSDTIKNGSETSADCGGTCDPCANGKTCSKGTDCATGLCIGGACHALDCTDGQRDGDETDVDCGGATCPKCDNQKSVRRQRGL